MMGWSPPKATPHVIQEFDLGPDDILVLTGDEEMSIEARKALQSAMNDVLNASGRRAVFFGGNLRITQIVHRKPATDALS